MTTIATVFKMFPQPIFSTSMKKVQEKTNFEDCFSEGLQNGCQAFHREMCGHPKKVL